MNIQKTKEAIALLERKVADMNRVTLNAAQVEIRNEMVAEIQRMKGELPEDRMTTENFGGERSRRSADAGIFRNLAEQLVAVAEAGRPGGRVDERLHQIRAASGMGESIPDTGGFLVATDFSDKLIGSFFAKSKLAPLCGKIQISSASNSVKINCVDEQSRATGSRWGGVNSYWLGEDALITGTKPKFRQMTLILKKLCGLCYATDELMADGAALEAVVSQAFASELAFVVDDCIVNGTGAGQPLGILNSGCLVSVAKESGQRASTLVAENIVKMYSRLLSSSLDSAVWLINKNVLPQLYTMSLAVGTGGIPLYMPAGGLPGKPDNTLFGLPVIAIEQCATLGTVGDIILADLKNGYLLAEKGGLDMAMSIHVRSTKRAAYISDDICNSSLIRGSLNSEEHGNPEPSRGFMPRACVETIQEPTYSS